MKIYEGRTTSATRLWQAAAAGLFALTVCAAPAAAQRGSYERMRMERNDQQMREVHIKRLESKADSKAVGSAQPRLFYEQIREDFRRMQIVNNEMLRATFSDASAPRFDYPRIAKAAGEINRRASRLKTNLQLPKPEDESEAAARTPAQIAGGEQLKSSLLALDRLIMSFVKNPAFHKSDVVDAQHSARARRQLIEIVELSRVIRQSTERVKN